MKKIVTIFTGLLFMSGVSIAQSINMSMDTPEGSVRMGVDVKETEDGGVQMNMKVSDPNNDVIDMGTSASPKGIQQNMKVSSAIRTDMQVETAQPIYEDQEAVSPRQSTAKRCVSAMPTSDFNTLLGSVKKQNFSDTQTEVVKQALTSNCFSSNQVKDLMRVFSFEEDKLNIAKMCYTCVVDKQNYYNLNDMFSYSSSVEELTKFIQSK